MSQHRLHLLFLNQRFLKLVVSPFALAVAVVSVACLLVLPTLASSAETSPIGQTVADFTLDDFRGKTHSLSDFSQRKAVVIAFLGTECPLAKLYGHRLQTISDTFGHSVAVVGINANRHDSITEIAAYARRHHLEFPILKDVGNKVADAIGARRTPEVFLLDQKGVIRYRGRIDDQYGVGYTRDAPKSNDLKNAVQQLLAGQPVTVAETPAIGCLIGRVRPAKTDSRVTYTNQISRILQKRCVECHRDGEIAPFSLTEYSEVAGWAEMIREVVQENRMPPWHADPAHGSFSNDRHLSKNERQLINDWVDAGAPEGDRSQLPQPTTYTTGWQLAKHPDRIVNMRRTPFKVPAEGVVRYQHFDVDPQFTEDKWVTSAEIMPGNRAVVHHILVFAKSRESRGDAAAGGGAFLAGYVPGQRNHAFPKGMAKLIPAGSILVFQVHYTPIGTQQEDLSSIGFLFAESDSIDQAVITHETRNDSFRIPPQNGNYKVEVTSDPLPIDAKLLGLMPHMHVRGKSFSYEARFPDGTKQTLLDVPAYDFNWQTSYRLIEPLTLPANTRLHCIAHFDNSDNNLNNPDSSDEVRWGDQTWDEMMIGYVDIAIPRTDISTANDGMNIQAARILMKKYDKNSDGEISRDEISRKITPTFNRLDTDKNDIVTLEELRKLQQ